MTDADLLVFGSGSLTRALVMSLAARDHPSLSVVLVGRDQAPVDSIAMLARARAAALGASLRIHARTCDFSRSSIDRVFAAVRPRVVLILASRQSPWRVGRRWRELLSLMGYGFTLPLQAVLADLVVDVAVQRHLNATFVNGCYPDLVNPLLVARGLPIVGGIGNVSIIASVLRSFQPERRVQIVAHHAHVAALISGRRNNLPAPLIWLDGERWTGWDSTVARSVTLPATDALNDVTGAAAVPMLAAMLGRSASWDGHAPGPNGECGGYPVRVDTRGVQITLPADISIDEARALNVCCGVADGVIVEKDEFRSTRTSGEIERVTGIQIPDSLLRWRADELYEQATRLASLRSRLDPDFESR
jgi:hypothetical protein